MCGSSRRDTDVYSRHATRTTRIVFNSSTAAVIKGACGTTQFLHVPKRPKRILGRNDVYAAVAAKLTRLTRQQPTGGPLQAPAIRTSVQPGVIRVCMVEAAALSHRHPLRSRRGWGLDCRARGLLSVGLSVSVSLVPLRLLGSHCGAAAGPGRVRPRPARAPTPSKHAKGNAQH